MGGGAWNLGFGGIYNGSDVLRRVGEGVVVVAIQYRLGVFGFLSGQRVKEGDILNAGICEWPFLLSTYFNVIERLHIVDQQFALQWIQKHVS